MTTGEQLKSQGMADCLAAATAPHRTYRQHAEDALEQLIAERRQFTADDIRARIPRGVQPHSPNVLPSVVGSAAARRRIVRVADVRTIRASRHSSRNGLWVAA